MNADMNYLVWMTLLTSLMWIPYVLNMILVRGLINAVGYPENPKPLAAWAQRAKNAHVNAVENLVLFAALVLAANVVGASNEMTATAALVYVIVRIIHWCAYSMAIPWVRTLTFVAGFACQVVIAIEILS